MEGVATIAPQSQSAPAMVGRKSQLKRLAEAYEATKGGMATAVFISGPSGAGKSTLMAHFLKTLPTEGEALILYGRCFEQESVPFKAVDEIAEALARYLRSLAPGDADGLVPESAGTLPHIFPALDRVDAIEQLRRGQPAIHDPQEMRRKAFTAFRELIAQIAARHVVILAIDDLQWGDLDSALLLVELLIASNPPRILLLGTYRNDFSEAGACMKTLRAVLGTAGSGRAFYELDIAPLDDDDARELASEVIGGIGRNLEQLIVAIVHESRGDPYAIVELARQAKAERRATGDDGSCKVDLGDVIWSRIDRLPDGSRRLLDVIALAGRPLSQRCAYRAAEL
jgi:predicted ATPase